MDPDGGWPELTIDEKMDVLQTICRIECRYLGMRDSAPALELAYLEEGLLGQYNHETDKITLSYNYITPTGDSRLSYYLYYSQRLERDAEKYGNEAVNDYYEQIQEYLGKSE